MLGGRKWDCLHPRRVQTSYEDGNETDFSTLQVQLPVHSQSGILEGQEFAVRVYKPALSLQDIAEATEAVNKQMKKILQLRKPQPDAPKA